MKKWVSKLCMSDNTIASPLQSRDQLENREGKDNKTFQKV